MEKRKGIGYALLTAALWGFLAIGLKVGSKYVDSVTIVWFRFTLAFLILFVYHLIKKPGELKILIRPPFVLVLAALALTWNYIGFMLGIEYTTPASTQVVVQIGPILLAFIGIVFFREKMNYRQVIGFVLAVVGMIFFYFNQLKVMFGAETEYNKGFLFTLSAACSWALYGVLQKRLVANRSTLTLNLFIFGLPSIILLPFIHPETLGHLHWGWWLLMIAFGLNTLIAYGSLALALKHLEASKVSIILIMNPVITFIAMAILGYMEVSWITAENFTFAMIFGALVVLAGAVMVVKKAR